MSSDAITIKSAVGEKQIALLKIDEVALRKRLLWSDLIVSTSDGGTLQLRGFSNRSALQVVVETILLSGDPFVTKALEEFSLPEGQYLTHRLHKKWLDTAKGLIERLPWKIGPEMPSLARERFYALANLIGESERARESRNHTHVDEQRRRHSALFDKLLGYPLNEDQISAILHDEDNALVVAGAGTGKTSTIVGKVAYLLQEELVSPDKLLLLAFTRKAAEELKSRLEQMTGATLEVKTFHSLGMQGVAKAVGKKPSLSRLAEDDRAFRRAIQEILESHLDGAVGQFLAFHQYPLRAPESFRTEDEYHRHIKGHGVRSLKGELLKSVEESQIANWLALNRVSYEYERKYEHDTASVEYRQYKPDFYLPAYEIYIEHFGLNSQGNPPSFIADPKKYLDGIEWKRKLHAKHQTTLVETFSHQAHSGTLFRELEAQLKRLNVEIKPLPPDQRRKLFTAETTMHPMVSLAASFLNLFKGNLCSMEEVRARVAPEDRRASAFLAVFCLVIEKYQLMLDADGSIDFNDMINLAARHAADGRFAPGYRYVLIDEFQDISRGRAMLVRALLAQVEGAKLFCVGDDWQSIYRFTGSDIDLMTQFPKHFGFTRRTDLRQTHRFKDKLLDASSRFIMANPQQMRKELVAKLHSDVPCVRIVSRQQTDKLAYFVQILDEIAVECQEGRIDVLVVGRYHFVLNDYRDIVASERRIKLQFLSVHAAKGLEADYTIVLDVVSGRHGFPTEITDDPLLELVLAENTAFPHAEERRLFYVAMTRARFKTFVVTDDIQRSVFVDELEGDDFSDWVIPSEASTRIVDCPKCRGGRLVRKKGGWGFFWGCSNYPGCKSVANACPWCGVGAFVREAQEFQCANGDCKRTAPVCPSCKVGAVVRRTGPYGPFYACSEWRAKGPSCSFTRVA